MDGVCECRFSPPIEYADTRCNYTTHFWVRLQGLPYDYLRYGVPALLVRYFPVISAVTASVKDPLDDSCANFIRYIVRTSIHVTDRRMGGRVIAYSALSIHAVAR